MAEATLTGVWSGLYSYPMALEPVGFTATLVDWGGGLSGACEERSPDPGGAALRRRSRLSGSRDGTRVSLVKRYDGAGGWDHAVAYAGTLSPDESEIEGAWTIPGAWTGRFLMVRAGRTTEAGLRRAFEEA